MLNSVLQSNMCLRQPKVSPQMNISVGTILIAFEVANNMYLLNKIMYIVLGY